MKLKLIIIILLMISLSIATVGCNWGTEAVPPTKPGVAPSQYPNKPIHQTVEPSATPFTTNEEQTSTVTLAAVGDVLIHSSIYKDAKIEEGYDFGPMFERIKPFIESADLAMANQESLLGGVDIGLSDYPRFNSPLEVGDALKGAGFDIINLANNHTLDHGEQAISNTIHHLNNLGLMYTGAYESAEDQRRIRVVEKNGILFAFISYTFGTNGLLIPAGKEYLVNLIDVSKIKHDIAEARKLADVVVMNVHFGQEYVNMPNKEQKEVAHAAAEAGADIIIGHHPHVLQPMEWIETTTGRKTFVVYSLGNFLAAQEGNHNRTGGIMRLEVVKTVTQGKTQIRVQKPTLIPTWITMTNWRGYKIVPLWEASAGQVSNASTFVKEISSHMNQWMPELQIETEQHE